MEADRPADPSDRSPAAWLRLSRLSPHFLVRSGVARALAKVLQRRNVRGRDIEPGPIRFHVAPCKKLRAVDHSWAARRFVPASLAAVDHLRSQRTTRRQHPGQSKAR